MLSISLVCTASAVLPTMWALSLALELLTSFSLIAPGIWQAQNVHGIFLKKKIIIIIFFLIRLQKFKSHFERNERLEGQKKKGLLSP